MNKKILRDLEKLRRVSFLILLLLCFCSRNENRSFPHDFLWGTAVCAFQTEMGNSLGTNNDPNSDWWVWTHWNVENKTGRVSDDLPENGPNMYDLYEMDFDNAKSLGLNAFRLSIEWSRIFPDGSGIPNAKEVEHYHKVFQALNSRGLKPLVTLHHFTTPLWLHDPLWNIDKANHGNGPKGWLEQKTVDEFVKFAEFCAMEYGGEVDLWATINEPMVVAIGGYLNPLPGNAFPPNEFNPGHMVTAAINLMTAHAGAYRALKQFDTTDADGDGVSSFVGIVQSMTDFAPLDETNEEDILAAQHASYLYNEWFLNAVAKGELDGNLDGISESSPELGPALDYIGVNYYTRMRVYKIGRLFPDYPVLDFLPSFPEDCENNPCSEMDYLIYPPGFYNVLKIATGYRFPVIITENGIADADDDQRAQFIKDHLDQVLKAINDGMDIRGYFYWSLVDNFEWALGFSKKFGLFSFDPVTKVRTMRPSAEVYKEIVQKNAI